MGNLGLRPARKNLHKREGARGCDDLLGIRGFPGQFRGVPADRRQCRQHALSGLRTRRSRRRHRHDAGRAGADRLSAQPRLPAIAMGISAAEQHALWWGGLRGALGLALALSLPPELPLRNEIVVVTFGVVAFSIIAQGLTMPLLLRWLGFLPAPAAHSQARGEKVRVRGRVMTIPAVYSPAISAACSRAAKTLPLKVTLSNFSPAFSQRRRSAASTRRLRWSSRACA